MSTINLKPDKVRARYGILTLDQCHTNKIELFQKERDSLPIKKRRLEANKQILANIEKKDPRQITDEDIKIKSRSKTIIEELNYEISRIETGSDEMEYYCSIVDVLTQYYPTTSNDFENYSNTYFNNNDNINDFNQMSNNTGNATNDLSNLLNKNNVVSSGTKEVNKLKLLTQQTISKQKPVKVTKHRVVKQSNASNILSSLVNINKNENCNKITTVDTCISNDTNVENMSEPQSESLMTFQTIPKIKQKMNNAELFEHYRYLTDPIFINENNKKNKNNVDICIKCGIEKFYNHIEGTLICKSCGSTKPLLIEAEKLNSKDKSNEKTTYPYKKINHLNEWLNQIQAKQTTDIPEFVFIDIKNELKKNREDDLSKLTPKRICEILKKLKLTKFKEHHIYILCQISNQKPPVLTREEEDTIREMFKDIQKPYEKYKPKKRINFSSYSFIIYKICELLELDHITKMLFLLKSKEKLRDLDLIWRKICYDLRWQYIPSTN